MKPGFLVFAICVLSSVATAQTNPVAEAARRWRQQHERPILEEFVSLLAIPNVSSDRANIQRNAERLVQMMQARGIQTRLLSVADANPVVFGQMTTPGATRTIIFYAHYDGQPLDPKEWASPPFTPTLRDKRLEQGGQIVPLPSGSTRINPEWRLYARGAADDKVPIMAILSALDAIRDAGMKTRSNVKFVFEGEEEAGSVNFEKILAANRELVAGDVWLGCDGPMHQTRQQSLTFGDRGIAGVDLTVYGPLNELHSGHYGNWAPNPAMMLAKLLASMKDDGGRILIDHFYDDVEPLSNMERRAIADAPDIGPILMRDFGLGSTENSPKTLAELITLPSLNIRGMASSRIGAQASNVIPTTATASIDMRLVKGMDPSKTINQFVEHVQKQGYFVVDAEPSADVRKAHPKVARVVRRRGGEIPWRVSMDLPALQEVIRIVENARGKVIKIPNSGGTGPDVALRVLGIPPIGVPIANHDDNQHSFNENVRLQNLWDGIELMAALLTM